MKKEQKVFLRKEAIMYISISSIVIVVFIIIFLSRGNLAGIANEHHKLILYSSEFVANLNPTTIKDRTREEDNFGLIEINFELPTGEDIHSKVLEITWDDGTELEYYGGDLVMSGDEGYIYIWIPNDITEKKLTGKLTLFPYSIFGGGKLYEYQYYFSLEL